jgi:Glycosyl transferases group 1
MNRPCRAADSISCAPGVSAIYYFCPDIRTPSAGVRRLYRHVKALHEAAFPAFILHEKSGFRQSGMPSLPVAYLNHIESDERAAFVIPEGMPRIMYRLKDHPGRRMVIALNWHHVFSCLPDGLDWRRLCIERVLVVSPEIGRMITWSMGLPVHYLTSGIDHRRYRYDPAEKLAQIAYIKRKAPHIEKLKGLLAAHNPDYCRHLQWVALDGLSEDQYAAHIRRASIFLTTSLAEGFPTSCLEAMAAGAIVAGYDGVGGRDLLQGDGTDQNCILAPNGDYLSLAYRLAPLLDDVLRSTMGRWHAIIKQALRTASTFTFSQEAADVVRFWNQFATRRESGTAQGRHPAGASLMGARR